MTVYLGCYTDGANANGLKSISLDTASGRMSVAAEYPVPMAIYQAFSGDGKFLYSTTDKGIASFKIDRQSADGRLKAVDAVYLGHCPCHVAALPGRVAYAVYLEGFTGSVPVEDGRFGEAVRHQHSGSGPNLPRQNSAHCHQASLLPDGSGYVVCDLGLDELVEYPSGRRTKMQPPGAGPRHLIFHPDGRLVFLVSELGNLVSSLSWSAADGFRILDTLPTLPPGDTGRGPNGDLAAAVRFTPDMKHIAVSNRGENSIVVYGFDETTGKLSFKARSMLEGCWPRDFIFATPDIALAAMERSGTVLSLRYDAASGKFTKLSAVEGLYRPVSLLGLAR